MGIDEHAKHIDTSRWENVALLVLSRLQNYDNKFDDVIVELKTMNQTMSFTANKVSSHDLQIKIIGFIVVLFSVLSIAKFF